MSDRKDTAYAMISHTVLGLAAVTGLAAVALEVAGKSETGPVTPFGLGLYVMAICSVAGVPVFIRAGRSTTQSSPTPGFFHSLRGIWALVGLVAIVVGPFLTLVIAPESQLWLFFPGNAAAVIGLLLVVLSSHRSPTFARRCLAAVRITIGALMALVGLFVTFTFVSFTSFEEASGMFVTLAIIAIGVLFAIGMKAGRFPLGDALVIGLGVFMLLGPAFSFGFLIGAVVTFGSVLVAGGMSALALASLNSTAETTASAD